MNALADLFVILLCLSGLFVILSLVCVVVERVPEVDGRPRRTRAHPQRPQRRSRMVRPRRSTSVQPVTDSPNPVVSVPAVPPGRRG